MPSTGTPKDNTPGSQCGALASYTEFGPPDRTTPAGSYLRICSIVAVQGRIALNTCCSRIRRAINCVYCPPKSSTTIPPRSLIVSSFSSHPVNRLARAKRLDVGQRYLQNSNQRLAAVESVVRRENHIVAREQHAIADCGAQPFDVYRLLQQLSFFLD